MSDWLESLREAAGQFCSKGLFVTGTDTGVGKTLVTCAIAMNLRQRGKVVSVCKPYATGCRKEREGLVNEDAEALAHFSDCRLPLATINPMRYRPPLAPAVAADRKNSESYPEEIERSLRQLDDAGDFLLIEGVGGVMVPLDRQLTLLDLMAAIGYPVVIVTHAMLGTLNHTAMTCRLIREAGLNIAGLVINRYNVDTRDEAEATNPLWLTRQNNTEVLATISGTEDVHPERAQIPESVIEAVGMIDWTAICRPARPVTSKGK